MSVIDNIRLTFLYIEFYSMGKTWVYPESYIPYNIFRYIVKGKAEFCIDGEEIIVKENQIVYIPQGCRMSCRALSESFEFYSLRFTTSVFYEGEDVLKEYYGIPRIIENEGEDYYFKEMSINAWNEFLYSLILINSTDKMTVSVALKSLQGAEILNWGDMMAASALVVVPSVIFFMFIQNKIAGGMTEGAVK